MNSTVIQKLRGRNPPPLNEKQKHAYGSPSPPTKFKITIAFTERHTKL
jgi:hypothetical protein